MSEGNKSAVPNPPTEVWRERQVALLRETEDRRLARRRRVAGSGRAIASLGRATVPSFRA